MRLITLFLIISLLVSVSLATQTKIDPGAQINWSKNISSQLHNVTNGTGAQDAATYSQLVRMKSNVSVTVGPYSWCDYRTDGISDEIQINDAIDNVSISGGGDVVLATANFNLSDTNGSIVVHERVRLLGTGITDGGGVWVDPPFDHNETQCSRIIIYGDTVNAAVQLESTTSVENIQFYYHDQPNSGSPITYPATIETIGSTDIYINHCAFLNSWIGVYHNATGRINVVGCTGYPIYRGIAITGCLEKCIIENNYFTINGYCDTPSDGLYQYIYANGTAIYITRCDGGSINNNLALGYKNSLYVNGSEEVACYGLDVYDNWFETASTPIYLDGTDHIQIHDNYLATGLMEGAASTDIGIDMHDVYLSHIYNNFIRSGGDGIDIDGLSNFAEISRNTIEFGTVSHGTTTKYGVNSITHAKVDDNVVYPSVGGSVTYTIGLSMSGAMNTCNGNQVFFCDPAGIKLEASSTGIAIGNVIGGASVLTDDSSGGWITGNTLNKIY